MENTKEYRVRLWKEISDLSDSLLAQIDEEQEGYASSMEGLGGCNKPLLVYFTKFHLKLDNGVMQLLKHAKKIKEMGIEDDFFVERARSYDYTPEEVKAFERWRETTRLLKEKSDEFQSLLT